MSSPGELFDEVELSALTALTVPVRGLVAQPENLSHDDQPSVRPVAPGQRLPTLLRAPRPNEPR